MEGFNIDECLRTITILVDTREQPSERATKRYNGFGCPWRREKLDFGDYSACFNMPDGTERRVNVAIERKMNLEELSSCLTQQRERFEAEFIRAQKAGASVYLLVEDATWENLINGKYRTKFNPRAYLGSVTSWIARYDVKPIFCKHESSGRLIREILFREIKERLLRGEYD